jgi:hypothetical protein
MRSNTKFQCDGCGEEFSLEKDCIGSECLAIRKALDAVAKAIDELRERLPG